MMLHLSCVVLRSPDPFTRVQVATNGSHPMAIFIYPQEARILLKSELGTHSVNRCLVKTCDIMPQQGLVRNSRAIHIASVSY